MRRSLGSPPNLMNLSSCGLAMALSSCAGSRLPDYARPTSSEIDPESDYDRISYRTLTPEDFLAKEPPAEMKAYAERMGAVTCAHLLTFPEPRYAIQSTPDGFEGAYENLDFVAKMDRDCSWWNPTSGIVPTEYVLQHEQIHFALAEIAARRLNQAAHELRDKLHPRADTQKEVEEQLVGEVRALLKDAISELLKVNQKFDEDTSNTYAPKKQSEWYDKISAKLKD